MTTKSSLIKSSKEPSYEPYILVGFDYASKRISSIFYLSLALSLLLQLIVIYFFPSPFRSGLLNEQTPFVGLKVDIEFFKPKLENTQSNEEPIEQVSQPINGVVSSRTSQSAQLPISEYGGSRSIDVSPDTISQAATDTLPEYSQNGSEGLRITPKYRRSPSRIETIRVSETVQIVRRGDTCFSVREPDATELVRGDIWSMPYFCGEPQSKKMIENIQQDFCLKRNC